MVNGRGATRLERVATQASAMAFRADLTRPGADLRLADFVLDHVGDGDLMVAGAGIGWAGDFADMPRAAVDEVINTDLLATVHLVMLLPRMVAAGGP